MISMEMKLWHIIAICVITASIKCSLSSAMISNNVNGVLHRTVLQYHNNIVFITNQTPATSNQSHNPFIHTQQVNEKLMLYPGPI
jgi:hypothetical protein